MPNEKTYPDAYFIDAVRKIGRASAADIAGTIGCNARIATNRLKVLAENGHIKSGKLAGRWIFWV